MGVNPWIRNRPEQTLIKIVNISKSVHSTAAFCFECVEDSTHLAFVPIDLALFGQPIPIGTSNRFNLFGNHTDFLDV